MRKTLRVLAGCAAGVALFATPALAQRPQTRQGFWIGFGFGGGSLNWDCDGCASQKENGPTGFVKLGGTPSAKVRLGAEINSWSLDVGAATISAGVVVFAVDWYPSADGGFFLTGGLGAATYLRRTASSDAESSSGALLLGTGYDIRVGRNISLTPMLTFWGSGNADLEDNGTAINTGLRHTGATLQLGITFH